MAPLPPDLRNPAVAQASQRTVSGVSAPRRSPPPRDARQRLSSPCHERLTHTCYTTKTSLILAAPRGSYSHCCTTRDLLTLPHHERPTLFCSTTRDLLYSALLYHEVSQVGRPRRAWRSAGLTRSMPFTQRQFAVGLLFAAFTKAVKARRAGLTSHGATFSYLLRGTPASFGVLTHTCFEAPRRASATVRSQARRLCACRRRRWEWIGVIHMVIERLPS